MAKTKPKKKGGLSSKLSSQVKAETSLRYDPQVAELKRTLGDLRGELTTDVQRAHAGAEGIRAAAKQAGPQLKKTYGEAQGVASQAQSDLMTKLGTIPQGNQLISSAAARDAEGTKRRLGEALAMATAETTKRAADAKSGEALQVTNLTAKYGSDTSRVRDKLAEIQGQKGTYAAARSGELSAEARKTANANKQASLGRGVTKRGQDLSHKDRVAARKSKTKDTSGKAGADFNDALAKAKAAVAPYVGKLPRPKIAALLSGGAPAVPESTTVDQAKLDKLIAANPANGEPGHLSEGELRRRATTKTPGAPAVTPVESSAALSAALDLLIDKHLSPATIAKLRKKYPGIRIKQTGLPTRGSVAATPEKTGSRGDERR